MNFKVSILSPPVSQKFPSRDLLLKELYGMIRSEVFLRSTLKLRAAATPQAARYIKMHEFYHATIAGTFSERSERGLKEMSGYMVFDFDKVEVEEVRKILLAISELPVCLLFISPSGNGIKAVYKIDLDAHSYLDYFRAISAYLESTCQLQADPSGKDIPRTCFLPCDPNAYFNEDAAFVSLDMEKWLVAAEVKNPTAKSYRQTSLLDAAPTVPDGLETIVRVEQLADYSAQFKIPLAENYNDWVALAMSLASLGESGRAVFLRCCDQYPKKQDQSPDKLFSYCLTHRTGSIGIGTFFKLASDAHIPLRQQEKATASTKASSASANPSAQKEETDEEEHLPELPSFSKELVQNLPPTLFTIHSASLSPEMADAFVMSSITVLSCAMPHVAGTYDGRKVAPNLYHITLGGAGVGKGQLAQCVRLVKRIHDELVHDFEVASTIFRRQTDEFFCKKGDKNESERPIKPNNNMLIIPANSTAASILDILQQNGGRGLIAECELDILSYAMSKDYGGFSPQLRNAAQHEDITYSRRKDEEYHQIKFPCLSIDLAGTMDQFTTLIPDSKNGLFSRFLVQVVPSKDEPVWRDPYAHKEHTIEQIFEELGDEYYQRYQILVKRTTALRFLLTHGQEQRSFIFFEELQKQYHELFGEDVLSIIRRLGLSSFRIMMVLSVLRAKGFTDLEGDVLICDDQDFDVAMGIIKTLAAHSAYLFSQLPGLKPTEKPQEYKKLNFYDALPDAFDRQTYLAIARQDGTKPSAADKRIRRFLQKNLLKLDDGIYSKMLNRK